MPRTKIVIYQEKDGEVPLLEWLDELPAKIQDKCIAVIELLEEYGNKLRRPHCDYLDKGIYELRARHDRVRYRILYSFVGEKIVLLSHGFFKKDRKVPKSEISKAIRNRENYFRNPEARTYAGEI